MPIDTYIARTLNGVAENSHLRSSNYFYYNCLTGHFLKDNCPAYLKESAIRQLQAGLVDRLTVTTGTFLGELRARKFTKVRPRRGGAGPALGLEAGGMAWARGGRACVQLRRDAAGEARWSWMDA